MHARTSPGAFLGKFSASLGSSLGSFLLPDNEVDVEGALSSINFLPLHPVLSMVEHRDIAFGAVVAVLG